MFMSLTKNIISSCNETHYSLFSEEYKGRKEEVRNTTTKCGKALSFAGVRKGKEVLIEKNDVYQT